MKDTIDINKVVQSEGQFVWARNKSTTAPSCTWRTLHKQYLKIYTRGSFLIFFIGDILLLCIYNIIKNIDKLINH